MINLEGIGAGGRGEVTKGLTDDTNTERTIKDAV